MLTNADITSGATRLSSGQLTAEDVDKLVGVLRMFFQDLEEKYSYDWRTKLTDLNDNADTAHTAAQVAACIDKMEGLGFGVSSLGSPGLQSGDINNRGGGGSSDGLYYKEKDEYWQYVTIVHTKFYALPPELSTYSLARRAGLVKSGTATSERVEPRSFGITERGVRTFARRNRFGGW